MKAIPPPATLFPYTTLFRSLRVPPFDIFEPTSYQVFVAPGILELEPLDQLAQLHEIDEHRTMVHPHGFLLDLSPARDRKSTRLNSSHSQISYAVFCLKKKTS